MTIYTKLCVVELLRRFIVFSLLIVDLSSDCIFFFFFKQKTAYEIYQCDWSSDVCSSDLPDDLDQVVTGFATFLRFLGDDGIVPESHAARLADRKSVV